MNDYSNFARRIRITRTRGRSGAWGRKRAAPNLFMGLVFLQVVLVGELLMLNPNFGCDPHYLSADGLQSCLSQAPQQELLGALFFVAGVAFIAATATYSLLYNLRLVHPNGVVL